MGRVECEVTKLCFTEGKEAGIPLAGGESYLKADEHLEPLRRLFRSRADLQKRLRPKTENQPLLPPKNRHSLGLVTWEMSVND
jgi:hypothetical protein